MNVNRTLRAFALAILGMGGSANAAAAGYYAQDGKLFEPSGEELQVRGISHFGFETLILQPQYLWEMGWKEQIAQIKSLGFNSVRVPFTPDTLYETRPVEALSYLNNAKNGELIGKTPLQVLDLWMAEADRQGLYVMLDFHSVTKHRLYPSWFVSDPADFHLVYNRQAYTKEHWLRDLAFVARRYAHLPRFFAVDVYNEPNGRVRWSTGDPNANDPAHYWKSAAESAASAVLMANPRLLIFVQGITNNHDGIENSNLPMNWGENFQPQAYQPLNIPHDKLVLSPHSYGPDVFEKSTFGAPAYPANLAADWETLFGRFHPRHPVVVSEWGGRYGDGPSAQRDVAWQNAFVAFLGSKGIHSSFYWCYTPNSGDSGGILDDQLRVREDKLALLRKHWTAAPPVTQAAPASFTATFTLSPEVNEWWAEMRVQAKVAVTRVEMQINGGSWISLTRSEWDSWYWSAHIPKGSQVMFRASDATGRTVTSAIYAWLSSVPVSAPAPAPVPAPAPIPAPAPAPAPAQFTASFSLAPGINEWWAEVSVQASAAPSNVQMQLNGGSWLAMTRSEWGSWFWNAHIAKGSQVRFRASDAGGNTAMSQTWSWLGSSNATAPAPQPSTPAPQAAPAPVQVQPWIRSFSPASGPAGTVVTIQGSGLSGLDQAWAGTAHNASVRVISDSEAQVTIPQDATTGSIGIFNDSGVAFTPSSFTVTSTGLVYRQPWISMFWPQAGPAGTVVTLMGKGFTGLDQAWAGSAHNAGVRVISDSQVEVTIPAGASSGAIGIFNPAKVAFTATPFTLTAR